MGALRLESYSLRDQKKIKSYGDNTRVFYYVWNQVKGKRGFKSYNYKKLKYEICSYVLNASRVTSEGLVHWVRDCHGHVSLHAFDSTYKKFLTFTNARISISLVYIVKGHHCFPISDYNLKIAATKANQGGSSDLLEHMSDNLINYIRRINLLFCQRNKNG